MTLVVIGRKPRSGAYFKDVLFQKQASVDRAYLLNL